VIKQTKADDRIRARVRQLREEKGLSGEVLAAQVTAQGVHMTRSTLANYENGSRSYLTLVEAQAIALALGVYLVDLFVGEEETSTRPIWTAPLPVDPDGRRDMTARELRLRLTGTAVSSELVLQLQDAREALDSAWNSIFGTER
jgi:transcriptional regulator with XRE-family HTH domain